MGMRYEKASVLFGSGLVVFTLESVLWFQASPL